jgi:hypothetical protein
MTEREALLREVGKTCSDNFSPTLRSKLIKVNKNTCTLMVVENEDYPHLNDPDRAYMIGRTKVEPIWLVANMFFGV